MRVLDKVGLAPPVLDVTWNLRPPYPFVLFCLLACRQKKREPVRLPLAERHAGTVDMVTEQKRVRISCRRYRVVKTGYMRKISKMLGMQVGSGADKVNDNIKLSHDVVDLILPTLGLQKLVNGRL